MHFVPSSMIREKPADSSEHAWREFCTYCSGHNIGNHYDHWSPWWDIWKIAYNFGKVQATCDENGGNGNNTKDSG